MSRSDETGAVSLGQSGIPNTLSDRDKCIAWALGLARVYMERLPGWRLWRVITDPIRANTLIVFARGLITAQPVIDDAAFRIAQGIEAGTDPTDESPVAESDAPNQEPQP